MQKLVGRLACVKLWPHNSKTLSCYKKIHTTISQQYALREKSQDSSLRVKENNHSSEPSLGGKGDGYRVSRL